MDDVLRLASGVRLHEDHVRGQRVLLAPERVFQLDETAYAVLSIIDGIRPVSEVVRHIIKDYNGDAAVIGDDVMSLLNALVQRGVLIR